MQRKVFRTLVLILLDLFIINSGLFLALLIRFDLKWSEIPSVYIYNWVNYAPWYSMLSISIFYLLRLYSFVLRLISVREVGRIIAAVSFSSAANVVISQLSGFRQPISVYCMTFVFTLALIGLSRFFLRLGNAMSFIYRQLKLEKETHQNVMIVGSGIAGQLIIRETMVNKNIRYHIRCIIDDNPNEQGMFVMGIPVIGGSEYIMSAVDEYKINTIIFAKQNEDAAYKRDVLEICNSTGCQIKVVTSISQLELQDLNIKKLKNVSIEDLLGRETVKVNVDDISKYVSGKSVLVTGGGGSIGSELCRQIAQQKPEKLIVFDIYENNAYYLQQELLVKNPDLNLCLEIGSVGDLDLMDKLFEKYRPQIVFHAAAHKHVPMMEQCPNEAVKNNVFGTYNTAKCADKYGSDVFVLISTDKAVNPTSVMGATKRLCEMIVQCVNKNSKTIFTAVRFGNVLGSSGSVIPLFKRQIANGGPVTVTHPDIIRYFMTIPEAVALVLQAGAYAKGGELFILDMGNPVKIDNLARNLIRLMGLIPDEDIKIEYTGLRPGEKLYEELLTEEEGLVPTDNLFIRMLNPAPIDEYKFFINLKALHKRCYENREDIKAYVAQMVNTYKMKEEPMMRVKYEMPTIGQQELSNVLPNG